MRSPLPRCAACFAKDDPKINPVPGDGPMNSRILFVGEGPGKFENNILKPFVGKTGEELNNTYLPLAGCSRYDIRCTNTFRCKYADSSDTPSPEIIKVCAETHLRPELESLNPEILVLMGGIANSLLHLDVDTVHGTGRISKLWNWEGKVFSVYHPALGLHKSSAMQSLLDDFKTLKGFIRGDVGPLVDAFPNPAYYRLRTAAEVDAVMEGRYDTPLAIDTESRKVWNGYRPMRYIGWCLTFCLDSGEAFMIRETDKEAISRFAYHARKFKKIYMHNEPHDQRVLGGMGVELEWERIVDTMSLAYNDARLPKGLKPLSYQLLGTVMRNFDDVVLPYGRRAAIEYVDQALGMEWPEPVQEPTGEIETRKCKECKGEGAIGMGRGKKRTYHDCPKCHGECYVTQPKMTRRQGIKQKLSRLVTDYLKNPEIDVVARWENWGLDVQPLIDKLGPLPLPSVELVPEDEIIEYAGADAHSTRRVGPLVEKRLVELRRRFNGRI